MVNVTLRGSELRPLLLLAISSSQCCPGPSLFFPTRLGIVIELAPSGSFFEMLPRAFGFLPLRFLVTLIWRVADSERVTCSLEPTGAPPFLPLGGLRTRKLLFVNVARVIAGNHAPPTLTLNQVIERITHDLEFEAEDGAFGVGALTNPQDPAEGAQVSRELMISTLSAIAVALGERTLGN